VNRIEELCGPLDKKEYSHRIHQTMLNFVSCGCLPFFLIAQSKKFLQYKWFTFIFIIFYSFIWML